MFFSLGIFGFGTPVDPTSAATVTSDRYLRSPWIPVSGELAVLTPNSLIMCPANGEPARGHVVIYGGLGLSAVFLFAPLGQRFLSEGYSVEIQDLPGSGSCHAHAQATDGTTIESFLRDDLTRVVKEHGSAVQVVAFSTAALVMITAIEQLPVDVLAGIERICYISVPVGIRGWTKALLGKLITSLEHAGTAGQKLAQLWDMVWVNLDTHKKRHIEAQQPIPQLSWYPARTTSSLRPYQVFAQHCSRWSAGLPLTVIHGDRDGKCPWEIVERTVEGLDPKPTLHCLPGAGHAIPLGRAASSFYDLMQEWLSSDTLPS